MQKRVRPCLGAALFGICAVSAVILNAPAVEAETIGTTITTKSVVRGTPPGIASHLKKGRDPIYRDELIETGANSAGQFEFVDRTGLALGPNSRLVLNRAVFSGPERHRLVRGTLRFATDIAAPSRALVVDTPIATLGVRGTIFDVHVADDGTTTVLLVRGGPVDVCSTSGTACIPIERTCEAVRVQASGGREGPVPVRQLGSRAGLGQDFPFASGAQRARRFFTRRTANCQLSSGRVLPIRDEDRRSDNDRQMAPDRSEADTSGEYSSGFGNPSDDTPSPTSGETDSGTGDTGRGDTGSSDTGTGDTGTSDTGTGDTGTGDAGTADPGTPDPGTSDAGTPGAGANGGGTQVTGTPGTGNTNTPGNGNLGNGNLN